MFVLGQMYKAKASVMEERYEEVKRDMSVVTCIPVADHHALVFHEIQSTAPQSLLLPLDLTDSAAL